MRQSLPSFVEQFLAIISYIGDGPALVALVMLVYWSVDKRIGQMALACFGVGNFISQLLKNIACVYRPWIRDARIVVSPYAVEGAGGYSFPSGHVTGTVTSLGMFAWMARKRNKVITVICVVVILLMMFSRNFLGVHTPQDVLVALLIGIAMIAIAQAFFNWIELRDIMTPGHNIDLVVTIVLMVVSAASVALVVMKPYPMDYVDGALLVDPVSMQKGSFEAAGILAGFALSWLLERRFIDFKTDSSVAIKERIVRGVVGVAIVGVTYVAADVVFKAIMTYIWAKMCAMFCVVFVAVFVVPLTFNLIGARFGTHPTRASVKEQMRD